MATPPGIKYFDELEDKLEAAVANLKKQVTDGNPALLEQLQDLLGLFEKRGGNLKQSTANIKRLTEISKQIDAILKDSALAPATSELLKAIPQSKELVNAYFLATNGNFKATEAAYSALTEFYTQYTANSLIGQGVNQQFKQGIIDVLRQSVKNGISTGDAKKLLAQYVVEDNKLGKHVGQVASDSLHQYSAEYTQAITDDLGLDHYYYKGTKIDTTRDFCAKRYGKYFTKKEVQGWASLDWDGKIEGTNKNNITLLRGGWNCKHLLVPVSESVYKARVNATKPV